MRRIWLSLLASALLGAASLPAQTTVNPGSWSGGLVPVVITDARAQAAANTSVSTDPYALVGVRRSLPWLGGIVGSGNNNFAANGVGINGPLINSQAANGSLGGGSSLFGGGSGLLGNGPSFFTRSPWFGGGRYGNGTGLFQGHLFPGIYNRVNSRLWLTAEWLLWDTKGMDTPALVTSSTTGTPRDTAAVLGEDGVSVLFGNQQINGGTVSGLRIAGGFWLTPQQDLGIEAEYFRLSEQNARFNGDSDGSVILGRPFFDIVAGQETAQLVSFPGLVSGGVNVDTRTNLRSIMINGRAALCPSGGACCNQCGIPDRVDWIVGFRHTQLDDTITINESLNSLIAAAPGTIELTDRFRTTNDFNGLQLGIVHRANFRRAYIESMLRIALGNNQQTVQINGNNTITEAGLTDVLEGGLLAQRTNIGSHKRDKFSMIPEVGVRLGWRLSERLSAKIGYSVIYFPNVIRAGDQIDTDLNPGLVPPEIIPFSGALRPGFRFVESDYWAHGLTLGGELAF